jgi:hypothetical protein
MGCGQTQTVLAPRTEVPASLLTCSAQPVPGTVTNDTDLTDWIQDLAAAGADCRSKLQHVGEIVNPTAKGK